MRINKARILTIITLILTLALSPQINALTDPYNMPSIDANSSSLVYDLGEEISSGYLNFTAFHDYWNNYNPLIEYDLIYDDYQTFSEKYVKLQLNFITNTNGILNHIWLTIKHYNTTSVVAKETLTAIDFGAGGTANATHPIIYFDFQDTEIYLRVFSTSLSIDVSNTFNGTDTANSIHYIRVTTGVEWYSGADENLHNNVIVQLTNTLPYAPEAATATPTPNTFSGDYGEIANILIPIACILVPSFIFGFLFRMGKWGFIIGGSIGAGLGYITLGSLFPLWILIAFIIIVTALTYQTVRGGSP